MRRPDGQALQALGKKIQASLEKGGPEELLPQIGQIGASLKVMADLTSGIAEWAQNKQIDKVLFNACDFLEYCGHLVTAWRLLDAAQTAAEQLKNAPETQKPYLQSKIDDVKVFCHVYLNKGRYLGAVLKDQSIDLGALNKA